MGETKARSRVSGRGFHGQVGGVMFAVSPVSGYSVVTALTAARAADSSTMVLFAANVAMRAWRARLLGSFEGVQGCQSAPPAFQPVGVTALSVEWRAPDSASVRLVRPSQLVSGEPTCPRRYIRLRCSHVRNTAKKCASEQVRN